MIVFGDSLSAWRTGWVGQLMAQGEWYKLHAQSMRFGATQIVPTDLLPFIDDHKTAFYWLGTNDAALWGTEGFQDEWYNAFHQDMSRLIHSTFGQHKFNIILILPPTITLPDRDTRGIRYIQAVFYEVVAGYFRVENLRLIDPDDYDVLADSPDGVHLSETTAASFGQVLHQFALDWENE